MKTFCNGCIHEGDYSEDPYGLNFCSDKLPQGYFRIIDCKKHMFKPRRNDSNIDCKFYVKCGQLSLFD